MDYLAFDLGAESGRAIVGRLQDERLELFPIYRFPNLPIRVLDSYHWDVLHLFQELVAGLALYRRDYGERLEGIGVDTWGVDFALLDHQGKLLGNPYHYRDPRTEGMLQEAFRLVPREEIFRQTGIQFMEINTLYQLLAMRLGQDPLLQVAKTLVMMPDLLNYWLTGVITCEFSAATTSQCYNPRSHDWAWDVLSRLGLPTGIFQPVVQPGTVIGPLHGRVAEQVGLQDVRVIAPASHDTGSAVAAVPAASSDFCYISSGTWSLMGIEVQEPVISEESLAFNFTNEGGVCGTFRLLKNIMGLWLVQECRRTWASEGHEYSYPELTRLAAEAPAFGPVVDPDSNEFLRPGDMPARIRDFCLRTGQSTPETVGEIVRCALESLALKYRWVLEKLEHMSGQRLSIIHIVGGGSQNDLLCQLAADATQRPVLAGPVEATAAGNVLVQALACGQLDSLTDIRNVVRRSFELTSYQPHTAEGWDEAYARFCRILQEGEER